MANPIKISDLPQISSLSTSAVFPVDWNGQTWRSTIEQLLVLAGSGQTLSYNPETGVLSLSGGNDVNIPKQPSLSLVVLAPLESASTNLPAGSILHKLRIKSTEEITFSLGTSAGGNQILDSEIVSADTVGIFNFDFDSETVTTIHFSGLAGNTNIKLFIAQ